MRKFEGRVALVTGAGGGIGRASAMRLAAEGAAVGVLDIDGERAEEVAAEIRSAGGDALALAVDLEVEAAIVEAVAQLTEAFGGITILHNNAAALDPATFGQDVDLVNMSASIWDHVLGVNLRGQMLCIKHALPTMISEQRGAIINMTSIAGIGGSKNHPAYSASKGAIIRLTVTTAHYHGRDGIRCNAIAPGFVMTPAGAANTTVEMREAMAAVHLTPRVGRPEDIASAVSFLADDEQAGFITGHTLVVDGGWSTSMPSPDLAPQDEGA